MASNSEYEQQRCFKQKMVRIDGGVDGRKTWRLTGNSFAKDLYFESWSDEDLKKKGILINNK